jgi:hypothetical protein
MGLWAVGASVVAVLRFSWEPRRRATPVRAAAARAPATVRPLRVVRTARRGTATLLWGQIRHATRTLWRDPGSVFFAVAFPILLLARDSGRRRRAVRGPRRGEPTHRPPSWEPAAPDRRSAARSGTR